MKVAVAVHGRFHAFDLAAGLHRRGLLARLLTTYPTAIARRFVGLDMPLQTAPLLEAARRLSEWSGIGGGLPVWTARRFGEFAAHHMPQSAHLFVGWSGASLEAIRRARERAIVSVLERGSTHILHQRDALRDAHCAWGTAGRLPEPALIEREIAEYDAVDAIMVPTSIASETFVERGIPRAKLVVNPYGIDIERWPAVDRHLRQGPVRILFVGSMGARKGVPLLLKAFSRLTACELHLVGPIEPGFEPTLRSHLTPGIVIHGPLRGADLTRMFAAADIFCLTSVEEGLALVLLQAMASGLPLVATPATGVMEIGGESEGALVVAPDSDEVARALDALARDPERRLEIGRRARLRVEAEFTVERYVDRAVAAYGRLLPAGTTP